MAKLVSKIRTGGGGTHILDVLAVVLLSTWGGTYVGGELCAPACARCWLTRVKTTAAFCLQDL